MAKNQIILIKAFLNQACAFPFSRLIKIAISNRIKEPSTSGPGQHLCNFLQPQLFLRFAVGLTVDRMLAVRSQKLLLQRVP